MTLTRTFVHGLIAAFAILLAGCSTPNAVPLSKSQDHIRDWLLVRTPLGSSSSDVYTVIKHQQWDIDEEVKKDGTLRQMAGHAGSLKIVASSIRCHLGMTHYVYFPYPTDVLATWAFDNDDRLIDVWVDQQTLGQE